MVERGADKESLPLAESTDMVGIQSAISRVFTEYRSGRGVRLPCASTTSAGHDGAEDCTMKSIFFEGESAAIWRRPLFFWLFSVGPTSSSASRPSLPSPKLDTESYPP
jgi:hypothetical protein